MPFRARRGCRWQSRASPGSPRCPAPSSISSVKRRCNSSPRRKSASWRLRMLEWTSSVTSTNITSRCSSMSGIAAAPRRRRRTTSGRLAKTWPSSTIDAGDAAIDEPAHERRCSRGVRATPMPVISSSSPPLSSRAMFGTSAECAHRIGRCRPSRPADEVRRAAPQRRQPERRLDGQGTCGRSWQATGTHCPA